MRRKTTSIDHPHLNDGAGMWRIARDCGLDPNSPYKYLLFCRDFATTSAVARIDGELAAFVTGYVRPGTATLFVWQIGVLDRFRGEGLASAMLRFLHERAEPPLDHLEASVTPGNLASRRLFERFAAQAGAPCEETELFGAELFPKPHEAEILFRIGPLGPAAGSRGPATTISTNEATEKGAPSA